jgi:hypothetical protein
MIDMPTVVEYPFELPLYGSLTADRVRKAVGVFQQRIIDGLSSSPFELRPDDEVAAYIRQMLTSDG